MKHFIFDMGGVLIKSIPHKFVKDEDSYVKCKTPEEEKSFMNTFIEFEQGIIDVNDFVKLHSQSFNKKGLTAEEYEQCYYDIGKKYGGVFPNTYQLLSRLKDEGNKVYLLSNLHEISFKDFSNMFDTSIFEELFLSYKIHMVKPNKDIYKYVINKIGDDPNNMYFFDDKQENVNAAIDCGINAFKTTGDILEKNIKLAKENIY